jgi:hypothetical protein
VLTFPIFWMVWTHFIGPALVVVAALWYVAHWLRAKLGGGKRSTQRAEGERRLSSPAEDSTTT